MRIIARITAGMRNNSAAKRAAWYPWTVITLELPMERAIPVSITLKEDHHRISRKRNLDATGLIAG
jgi:hypothetical protein